jgi:hypothetical protein
LPDLNLAVIHRLKEDRLIWEWGKDEGYTVNSCMLALERIRYVGSITWIYVAVMSQMFGNPFALHKQK